MMSAVQLSNHAVKDLKVVHWVVEYGHPVHTSHGEMVVVASVWFQHLPKLRPLLLPAAAAAALVQPVVAVAAGDPHVHHNAWAELHCVAVEAWNSCNVNLAAVHTAADSVDREHIVHKIVGPDVARIGAGSRVSVWGRREELRMPRKLHVVAFRPSEAAADAAPYVDPYAQHAGMAAVDADA